MASMWIIAGLCVCISFVHVADAAQPTWPELLESYDPVAADKSVVVSGNARFTVLTPRLIRMEYSDASPPSFEDRATTAFVNRRLAKPVEFQSASKGGILTITTSDVELQYHEGTQFAASTLSVSPTQTYASSAFQGWSYGASNSGNLLGTIRTLDMLGVTSLNCTENSKIVVHDEDLHCAFGLISKQDTQLWTTRRHTLSTLKQAGGQGKTLMLSTRIFRARA